MSLIATFLPSVASQITSFEARFKATPATSIKISDGSRRLPRFSQISEKEAASSFARSILSCSCLSASAASGDVTGSGPAADLYSIDDLNKFYADKIYFPDGATKL